MHLDIPYLREIMIFLFAAGLVVPVVRKAGISPVLGFLFVGLVIGPYGLGRLFGETPGIELLVIDDVEGVRRIAELGVVFLLFTIGLELSIRQLWGMRHLVFGLGAAQVAVSAIAIGLTAYGFGNPPVAATIFGLCLALSSTALVMQLLTETRRLNTPSGHATFGVLLLQDLAVVPILFFVAFAGAGVDGSLAVSAAWAIGEAVVVIAVIFAVGRTIVRPLLRFVGRAHSREAFMAAIFLLVLATGTLTALAGLSMALGAFLAGLLFAGTEYRHQVASDIEPFKGLLLGLFFISVGMSLDLMAVWRDLGWLVLSVVGLMALKATILFVLARAFGLSTAIAAESALLLSQGGEFAFVVIAAALALALLDPATAQFMLLVVVLTMFLTPALSLVSQRLGERIRRHVGSVDLRDAVTEAGHPVVIGGYGRVGRMLGALLDEQRIAYVAIDTDPDLVARERASGAPVYFGDASQPEVLRHLGTERAAALVTTMDEPGSAEPVIRAIRAAWPEIPIFARARDSAHARKLVKAGAVGAVPEAIEASLELCEQLLTGVGIPDDAARAIVDDHRARVIERGDTSTAEPTAS